MRTLAAFVVLAAAPAVLAQSGPYSSAAPPSAAALRPLNLATQWAAAVPVDGRKDGVARVDLPDADQVFVQTRGGLLVAFDAAGGNQQWAATFDTPGAAALPVGVNARFVFAVNLAKLYCFHRYTGVVEFAFPLPVSASSGPVADDDTVFIVLGSGRLAAFDLPNPVRMPDKLLNSKSAFGDAARDPRGANPADVVAARYPGTSRRTGFADEEFDVQKIRVSTDGATSSSTLQRTPSLAVVSTLNPPYRIYDDNGKYIIKTSSLGAVSSLRQPYHLAAPTAGSTQRTPSISAIPLTVSGTFAQTNLLPRAVEPKTRWQYGATVRLQYPPLLTRLRVWQASATADVYAVLKEAKRPQIDARMPDAPAAAPAQADDTGFFPLEDGNLLALDLEGGGGKTLKIVWRANVGGNMNHKPVPTADAVYVGGDNSGVARVDRESAEVTWRTDAGFDTLLAVNKEYAYIRDRAGRVHVFDRTRVSDAATMKAYPLASVELGDFNLAVSNDQTDRIYLAADNGLLVCLRDASPQYARPMTVAPPKNRRAPVKAAAPEKLPESAIEPKKEPEKKEPEKKATEVKKEPEKKAPDPKKPPEKK